jgi:hypothetical protein
MAVEKVDKPTLMIGKHVSGTVIGAVRNWSRNVVLWNLAADSTFEPHTNNGGCPICHGAVTIESNEVTRNLAYYTIAHFSKLVRAGSHRVDSSLPDDLPKCGVPGSKQGDGSRGREYSFLAEQTFNAVNHSLRHCKGAPWERLYGERAVEFSRRRKESLECPSKRDFTTSAFLVLSSAARPMRLKGFRLG